MTEQPIGSDVYRYIDKSVRRDSALMIRHANEICATYAQQGLTLTLRQIFYQFVTRNLFANQQKNYDRLGYVLNDARLTGRLAWDYIEDRTRFLRTSSAWHGPEGILRAIAEQYQRRAWDTQDYYVEVWIEKDALIGVIEQTCDDNRVGYTSCRGYFSQSEMREAGLRFSERMKAGKSCVLLHFGDHDPSGIDMTRDIQERLDLYTAAHAGESVDVRRKALTFEQVEQYDLLPNPLKPNDSRSPAYAEKYGDESWELDALEPGTINQLIQDEIDNLRDPVAWAKALEEEENERTILESIATRYDDITGWLDNDPTEQLEHCKQRRARLISNFRASNAQRRIREEQLRSELSQANKNVHTQMQAITELREQAATAQDDSAKYRARVGNQSATIGRFQKDQSQFVSLFTELANNYDDVLSEPRSPSDLSFQFHQLREFCASLSTEQTPPEPPPASVTKPAAKSVKRPRKPKTDG